MAIPHFLVIPYPVLGHVNPLLQFSHVLAKHGCKVTFLNTESSHKRARASSSESESEGSHIKFVTLPDGLGSEDDRNDPFKVLSSIKATMPDKLPKLIEDVNNALDGENKVSCIVVSINMGWALQVGRKLGIKGAVLFPASATTMASCDCIEMLIDDGIISSENGKSSYISLYMRVQFNLELLII